MTSHADARAVWANAGLFDPPDVHSREERPGNVTACYYSGLPWHGRATRIFALFGLPEGAAPDTPVPGMVLVHGGGGTAFPDWVRHWNELGYAAVAMDCCGCKGGGKHGDRPRHEAGGPPGWGGFDQLDEPLEDQWMIHAIAAGILAHSLLRSFPEVDGARIGLTGVSWGGIQACIMAALDRRFRFVVPVYGCGFLGELGSGPGAFPEMDDASVAQWKVTWDPSNYLPDAAQPMLWVNGTNDLAFSLSSMMRSYMLPAGPGTLSIQYRLPHGHQEGWAPREIDAFAAHHCLDGAPLARITAHRYVDSRICLEYDAAVPAAKAERFHTIGMGPWREREWERTPLEPGHGSICVEIPPNATGCFINLIDERGLTVSGKMVMPRTGSG